MRPLAVVTAGTHRLGASIVVALAHAGWDVAVHSRDGRSFDPAMMREVHPDATLHQVQGDLATEAGCAGIADGISSIGRGPATLLVNNASLFRDDCPATATHAGLLEHHAANVAGPVVLSRMFADACGGRDGCIVNILDQRIANPIHDQLSYTLSKLALHQLTGLLARALAPKVRVNAVAPGLVLPAPGYEEGRMDRIGAMMPLRRNARAEEVADAVVMLAGARAVTGQTVFVDGGASLMRFDRDFDRL